jgi:molybdate/tungstate transport system substrate-binding protein
MRCGRAVRWRAPRPSRSGRLRRRGARAILAGALLASAGSVTVAEAAPPLPAEHPAASCARDAGSTINVLHAGSLTNLVQLSLAPLFHAFCGATATDQGGPAVGLADAIKDGSLSGDVYMSADAHVNKMLIGPENGDWVRWYLAFARNQEVITYTPGSRFFAELERARLGEVPWYEVLTEPGFVLGRTDPNTDPGGYFALFVAGLAERYYGIAGLKQRLLGSDTNPDQLLTPPAFTTTASGAVPDATFGYLSSAVDKGLPYIALPPQINLSDPRQARFYARVSYTNRNGDTFRGAPIYDSVTVLRHSANEQTAIDFVRLLLGPRGRRLQQSRGFLDTPVRVGGDSSAVPPTLRRYIDGCYEEGCGRPLRSRHARSAQRSP